MSIEVNYFLIEAAFTQLEVAQIESDGALVIEPDDPVLMRHLFVSKIVPGVQKWSARYREKLRLSLAYYLRNPDVLDREVLANLQELMMPDPSDIVEFFSLLYQTLFPHEDWRIVDVSSVVENNDLYEMNRVRQPLVPASARGIDMAITGPLGWASDVTVFFDAAGEIISAFPKLP